MTLWNYDSAVLLTPLSQYSAMSLTPLNQQNLNLLKTLQGQ
jgi:hypothetical protein